MRVQHRICWALAGLVPLGLSATGASATTVAPVELDAATVDAGITTVLSGLGVTGPVSGGTTNDGCPYLGQEAFTSALAATGYTGTVDTWESDASWASGEQAAPFGEIKGVNCALRVVTDGGTAGFEFGVLSLPGTSAADIAAAMSGGGPVSDVSAAVPGGTLKTAYNGDATAATEIVIWVIDGVAIGGTLQTTGTSTAPAGTAVAAFEQLFPTVSAALTAAATGTVPTVATAAAAPATGSATAEPTAMVAPAPAATVAPVATDGAAIAPAATLPAPSVVAVPTIAAGGDAPFTAAPGGDVAFDPNAATAGAPVDVTTARAGLTAFVAANADTTLADGCPIADTAALDAALTNAGLTPVSWSHVVGSVTDPTGVPLTSVVCNSLAGDVGVTVTATDVAGADSAAVINLLTTNTGLGLVPATTTTLTGGQVVVATASSGGTTQLAAWVTDEFSVVVAVAELGTPSPGLAQVVLETAQPSVLATLPALAAAPAA